MKNDSDLCKIKNIKLDSLEDIKVLICDIIQEASDTGHMIDRAGPIATLINCWIRADHEERDSEDLEKRIAAIELKQREQEIKIRG